MVNSSYAKQLKQAPIELVNDNQTQPSSGTSFQFQQLQLSQKLLTTLDLESLIGLYFDDLSEQYNILGLAYSFPDDDIEISLGTPAEIIYEQRLLAEQDNLGTMTVFFHKKIKESNKRRIRHLTHTFAFSLRNALAFRRVTLSSQTDYLTGAGNRAAMHASLDRELELAQRHEQALSLLILDLDHFKSVNDQHGHLFGDKVLKTLVDELKKVARISDTVFRYGGEEFVLILNSTNIYGAFVIAERIRKAVERLQLKPDNQAPISLTISIGAATLLNQETASTLIQRADEQLYLAKSNGRNQVWGDVNQVLKQTSNNDTATA